MQPLLRMIGIEKRFTGVVALDGVDFDVRAGEVHALVGENGAGKSTLMKVLTGIYQPDGGQIELDGKGVALSHPSAARTRGIAIVHQELNLCPNLTVAENIYMGADTGRLGVRLFRRRDQERRAQALMESMGIHLDAGAVLENLSIGQRQMVEIAKALSQDVRILVLDEPTSSLSDADVDFLFTIIKRLKERGVGIVYISHRMKEIFHLCDRATILRDGRKVTTLESLREVSQDRVVSLMVGRDLKPQAVSQRNLGDVALEVSQLTRRGSFRDCSFRIRAGEIRIGGRPAVIRTVADSMAQSIAAHAVRRLNVRTPHLDQEIRFLSGGNQQKVVVGKWLSMEPKILILDEPTRGIDVGAKAEIYEMIQRLASQGTAIIMVSSELPELLANCDRIVVMAEGQITGELGREQATEDAVMALCHLPHMEAVQ